MSDEACDLNYWKNRAKILEFAIERWKEDELINIDIVKDLKAKLEIAKEALKYIAYSNEGIEGNVIGSTDMMWYADKTLKELEEA